MDSTVHDALISIESRKQTNICSHLEQLTAKYIATVNARDWNDEFLQSIRLETKTPFIESIQTGHGDSDGQFQLAQDLAEHPSYSYELVTTNASLYEPAGGDQKQEPDSGTVWCLMKIKDSVQKTEKEMVCTFFWTLDGRSKRWRMSGHVAMTGMASLAGGLLP